MAKRRDSSTGRMLFTDFDATEKGRPASLLAEETREHPVGPIPSIEEIASSLELDFEDDWGGEAPPSAASSFSGFQDEDDYIPDAPATHPADDVKTAAGSAYSAPARADDAGTADGDGAFSWDTFADAFQQAMGPARRAPERRGGGTTRREIRRTPAERERGDFDARDVDILSELSLFADEENEDDVLDGEEWRGRRLGVPPPRPVPYGGIERLDEWYRPPEETESTEDEMPASLSPEEWYEPPERDQETGAASVRTHAGNNPDTTTNLDLFSGVDLEALWEEKIQSKHRSEGGEAGGDPTDTRALDLFDDLDLDALWEEKRHRGKDAENRDGGKNAAPFSRRTSVMERDALGGMEDAGTLILPVDENMRSVIDAAFSGDTRLRPKSTRRRSPPESRSTRKRRTSRRASAALPPPEMGEDAVSFLDDLENFSADDGHGAASAAEVEPQEEKAARPPAKSHSPDAEPDAAEPVASGEDRKAAQSDAASAVGRKATTTDDFLDNLDLEDLDSAVHSDVRPPVVDDSDIEPMEREEELVPDAVGAKAAEDSPADPEDEGDPPLVGVEPPFSGSNGEEEDLVLADPIGLDALLARENAPPPSPDAEADAMDALEELSRLEERPKGEEDAEEPEQAVAVDPMDVFANMDDMDFSDDGLDDEMKAMLGDDGDGEPEAEASDVAGAEEASRTGVRPKGLSGKLLYYAEKVFFKVVPRPLAEKAMRMVAWRENWWFYCDLLAAIVSSASLAVIISYFLWYRK